MFRFFGYIDPGTGSLFLQTVIGVILGGIVVFRNFFAGLLVKIKTLITRQTPTNEED